jgi:hypothetical protein
MWWEIRKANKARARHMVSLKLLLASFERVMCQERTRSLRRFAGTVQNEPALLVA